MSVIRLHATTVSLHGKGVILTGPSGAGKSDLALRLIDRGALLVADDQTILVEEAAGLVAAPVPDFAGQMEIRGLGIVPQPFAERAILALHVDLETPPERMPEPMERVFGTTSLRSIRVNSRLPSAPILIEIALT
ncbi:MAG: HPr kinase/phosphatase C-terminal domain-containing protein [Pacificimonas sp.]